jgi:hypothetical protein
MTEILIVGKMLKRTGFLSVLKCHILPYYVQVCNWSMLSCWFRTWDSGVVATLTTGCPRDRGLIPGKGTIFITSQKPPGPLQWALKVHLPEVKRPGRKAHNSPSSSAHAKKEWSYTSTPTYAFVAVIRTTLSLVCYMCTLSLGYLQACFIALWKSAVRPL